jgi:hypothetical protein
MDPFSALGVAAAVFQFVDFGAGILKESFTLKRKEQLLTEEAFANAVMDINKLNWSRKAREIEVQDLPNSLGSHHMVSC